jgi:protein TonB
MSANNLLVTIALLLPFLLQAQQDTTLYYAPSGKIVDNQASANVTARFKTKGQGKYILTYHQNNKGKWEESSKLFIIKTNDTTYKVTRTVQKAAEQTTRIVSKNKQNGEYLLKDYKNDRLLSSGHSLLIFPEIKTGTWYNFYASGIKASEEYYADNQMTGNRNWNENGEEGPSNVFEYAQEMPEYPGGFMAMKKFYKANLHPSPEALKAASSRIVYIQFIVLEDGTLSGIHVAKGIHPLLDKEAERVSNLMPKWQPGCINSTKVKVRVTLPVVFK